jgi:DNA replication protein DnaC
MAGLLLGLIERPQLVAIGGERGTGKSAMACGLANAFCDLNQRARYATVARYFEVLSSAPWEEKAAARERFRRADLLVLDEVQVRDADRAWQDNELTSLIDARYADERATVLVSNLTPAALEQNLGASVCRRLNEQGGVYEAAWPQLEPLRQAWEAQRR